MNTKQSLVERLQIIREALEHYQNAQAIDTRPDARDGDTVSDGWHAEEALAALSQLERQLSAPLSDEEIERLFCKELDCDGGWALYEATPGDIIRFARALLAQRAAPQAQGSGKDATGEWRLVPTKPTKEMMLAFNGATIGATFAEKYTDMLNHAPRLAAAAPQAPQEPVAHLWMCCQSTGTDHYLKSGPLSEIEKERDNLNAKDWDCFIKSDAAPVSTISAKETE